MTTIQAKQRCAWVSNNPLYLDYHDHEWGIPIYDDRLLFELLILEGMQAGLSWLTILKKREHFRHSFDQFDAAKIAHYSSSKVEQLMQNEGIIRHRLKIQATITNAKAFLAIQREYGQFSHYLWSFVDNQPIVGYWKTLAEVPSHTAISDALSKDLKKRGFRFVGSTICYAFSELCLAVRGSSSELKLFHNIDS